MMLEGRGSLTAELHKEQHESTTLLDMHKLHYSGFCKAAQYTTPLGYFRKADTAAWNPQVEQTPLTFKCNAVDITKHLYLNI